MMTLSWPWPILGQDQISCHVSICMGKMEKNRDFSETIATCELKVCTCSQQNSEVRRVSRIKVIPWPWPKVTQIPKLNLVFLRNNGAIWNQISNESFWEHGNVILFNLFWSHDEDVYHALYMYKVKTPLKIFFCGTNWLIVLKLAM